MPVRSLYIRYQICAEITVGNAHGTRIAARTRPRPGKVALMRRAIPRPKIVSRATAMLVKPYALIPFDRYPHRESPLANMQVQLHARRPPDGCRYRHRRLLYNGHESGVSVQISHLLLRTTPYYLFTMACRSDCNPLKAS